MALDSLAVTRRERTSAPHEQAAWRARISRSRTLRVWAWRAVQLLGSKRGESRC